MAVSFDREPEAVVKPVSPSTTFSEEEPALALPTFGITKMIMYKIAIAIVGASIALGVLLTFAPLFSADVALAVIACFS
jgi:hypothetical protein